MGKRRVDGFFYGLFMDGDVLKDQSVTAINPRRAYVDDFELCIGRRSTLVPSEGERSYGVVYSLTHEDLERRNQGQPLRMEFRGTQGSADSRKQQWL